MKLLFLSILSALFIVSCTSTKTVKYQQKNNDIYTNDNLSEFLQKNKKPKVVLRVSDTSNNLTDEEDNSYLYNAIENELLTSGFVVRDRQLFNQIIQNEDNNTGYSNLKDKSDTDIILELTKLDTQVLYETNKYLDAKNRTKVEKTGTYKDYGAAVEFKVILIQNNEFAGRYTFHYTPCTEGCLKSLSPKDLKKLREKNKRKGVVGYEGVERDELEEFIKDATKRLVVEMRN